MGKIIWGGGGGGGSIKEVDFFQTKCKKYPACPEKPFLLKQLFCIVTPTLSTGSSEIFIKKGELSWSFCPLSGLKGGGDTKLSLKSRVHFFDAFPYCF